MTACKTSDALQEIHNQRIKDDSTTIRSQDRCAAQISTFRKEKKNPGKRNLDGPDVAFRLQLCGIASYCASACMHL